MAKKFTANCDFGGKVVPVTFYVGNPAPNSHPLGFQSKWLGKERGGSVPPDIMDSFGKLKQIADKNRVPFEDLCDYVIAELNSTETLEGDVNKATAMSNPNGTKPASSGSGKSEKPTASQNKQQVATPDKKTIEGQPVKAAQQSAAAIPSVKQKVAAPSAGQQPAAQNQESTVGAVQRKSFADMQKASQGKAQAQQPETPKQDQEDPNSSNN